jgi:hypothetical protein
MSDLRERLQELAEVAARHGRTPGPQAARRRARRRRLLAGGTAALVTVALLAVAVAVDRRLDLGPGPVEPPAATRPTASTTAPPASIPAEPGQVERPAGSPPGAVGEQMVRDVATVIAECSGGGANRPTVLVAWGTAHGRTWLIEASPPRPGEAGFCWAHGLFSAGGGGGVGSNGALPVTSLQASGSDNLRSGDGYWGFVVGPVTKQATRVRVRFDMGIPPLDLTPIPSGDRFPVNFYAGFYRQPARDRRPATWQVVGATAYDRAARKVAECRVGGPAHTC